MGLDFAEKVARSFRKGLDSKRVELGTPTLFTKQPECSRAYAATVRKGHALDLGEKLCIRFDGNDVVAMRGLTPVATLNNPPPDLKQALVASHGVACGTVQDVHEIAKTAEITVC